MFEIDFLPVANSAEDAGTKSGDAIAARFHDHAGQQRVIVIDAGFQATGQELVEHIVEYYQTEYVDLAISTHPDGDHINGLSTVIEELEVGELLVHQPRAHAGSSASFVTNIEAVDSLIETSIRHHTVVSSPFTGKTRFDGILRILGPDRVFYEQLLDEHIDDERSGARSLNLTRAARKFRNIFADAVSLIPFEETLTDFGETTPRNETSVVTLLTIDGQRILFTGDAGQRSLSRIADEYERQVGSFKDSPLSIIQVPHHGSRRNIGPTLLDRILGPRGLPHSNTEGIVSAARDAPKHPSAKVTNAFLRRGASITVTAGRTVCCPNGVAMRPGWGPAPVLPPLDEGSEEDD